MFREVALVVLLLALVHGQGQGGGQGKEGNEPKRPSSGRREKCDLANPPEEIDADVKAILKGLADGTKTIADIIPVLDKIPALCFGALKEKVESFAITEEQAKAALCQSKGDKMKIEIFMMRINEVLQMEQTCAIAKTVIANANCMESKQMLQHIVAMKCELDSLAAEDVFNYPPEVVKKYMDKLPSVAEKITFLTDIKTLLINDTELMKSIAPCVLRKFFQLAHDMLEGTMTAAQMVAEDSFWSTDVIFIPFMPNGVCEAITAEMLITNKDKVMNVDFHCNVMKEKEMKEKPQMGSGGQGGGDRGPGKPTAAQLEMLREEMRRAPMCALQCGRILIKKLIAKKNDAATSADDKTAIETSFMKLMECQDVKQLREGAAPGKCSGITADVLSGAGSSLTPLGQRALAKRCRPANKAAKDFTPDELKTMGCTVMAIADIEDVPTETLCDFTYLKDSLAGCFAASIDDAVVAATMDVIIKKCNLTAEQLNQMQGAAVFASSEKRRAIGKDLKGEDLQNIAKALKAMPKQKKREAVRDFVAQADPKELTGSRDFMRELPMKKVREAMGSQIEDAINGKDLSGMTRSQNGQLVSALMKSKNKGAKDLTPEDVEKMQGLARGLAPGQIRAFQVTRRREILGKICVLEGFEGRQSEALAEENAASLEDLDPANPVGVLTENEIEGMQGDCLARITPGALKNASRALRHAACARIGAHPQLKCLLNMNLREKFAEVCADMSDTEAGDTEADPVENAMALAADMDVDEIEKLDGARVLKIVKGMGPARCMKKKVRDAIRRKLAAAASSLDDLKDPEKLEKMGEFAYVMGMRQQAAEDILSSVVPEDSEEGDEDAARNMECCMGEMNKEDMDAAKAFMAEVAANQKELIETLAAAQGQTRRKRRQAAAKTCADITFISDKSLITSAEITAMSTEEFTACMEVFGMAKDLKAETAKTIMDRIRAGTTKICDFTAEHVLNLGVLGSQLTVEEINCLKSLDGLGVFSKYTQEQLMKFAAKYLALNNKASASVITAEDVTKMGHFICGLSKDEIASIPDAAFEGATNTIGQLEACPQEALDAWALKAVKVFGGVNMWESYHFAEAGILIGGLSAEDLNKADKDDVSGWTKAGVMALHPDRIKEVKIELLQEMNRNQAYALSDTQFNALDTDRKNAIFVARDGYDGATAEVEDENNVGPSGSGHVSFSAFSVLLTLVVALWVQ